jgi:hypothetical protein
MSDIVLVVEFVNLIGGADDGSAGNASLYLSSGPVFSGISSNLYQYLDRHSVARSAQRWNPMTCSTQFPELSFTCVDTGLDITRVLANNSSRVPGCEVKLWEGNDIAAFPGGFTRKFRGRLEEPSRSGGRLVFAIGSVFRWLEYPIDPVTGSAEIDVALTDPTALSVKLRNVVNLNEGMPNLTVNPGFETALGAEWVDDGSNKLLRTAPSAYHGGWGLEDTDALGTDAWRTKYQRINNISSFQVYQFSAWINSDGNSAVSAPVGQYELKIEEYDAGNVLLNIYTTGAVTRAEANYRYIPSTDTDVITQYFRQDGLILIPSATVSYVKLYIKTNHNPGGGAGSNYACYVDDVLFSALMLARCNNEVFAISSVRTSGTTAGTGVLAQRGMFGSILKAHKVGDEILLFNYFRGHFLDLIRRMITTTKTGTNGAYDDGSGAGLGAYFNSAWLNSTWDSEKVRKGAGSGPLDSYDYSAYLMDFTFDSRIKNGRQLIEKEMLLPMCSMLYVDDAGDLGVRILDAVATADGSSIILPDVMNDGAIIQDVSPLSDVITEVTYRFDHDPMGANDVQGELSGGSTRFLTERTFHEADFGDDIQPALLRYGVRPLVIDARGARGHGSAAVGLSGNLNGERTAFERARAWLTRWRFARQRYTLPVAFRRRGVLLGATPAVTSGAMVNAKTGAMGRSAELMFVLSQDMNYDTLKGTLELFAAGDQPVIPNTSAAVGMIAPVKNDWTLIVRPLTGVSTNLSLIGARQRRMKVYPRGSTNLGWVTLFYGAAGTPLAPSVADYLFTRIYIYAVRELTSGYPAGTTLGSDNGAPPTHVATTPYNAAKTYAIGNITYAADGLFYYSLAAGNIGNNPTGYGSPTKWALFPPISTGYPAGTSLGSSWITGKNYIIGNVQVAADGLYYVCILANNSHDPTAGGSPTWWLPYPSGQAFQVGGEFRSLEDEGYIMFNSGTEPGSYIQSLYVRLAYVNKDLVEGPLSDCKAVRRITVEDFGDRMPRKKVMQTGADGRRDDGGITTTWSWG